MAKRGSFDSDAFYAALDAQRHAQRKNWKDVATEAGVSASTLTRMAQGRRPDVGGLAALAAWSGLSADQFVRREGHASETEPLAMISTYLRGDRNLTREAADALVGVIRAAYEALKKRD